MSSSLQTEAVSAALKRAYTRVMQSWLGQSKFPRYIAIGFGCIGLRYLCVLFYRKVRRYPPGPIGLPFIGCLLSFARSPTEALSSYGQHYGAVTFVPILGYNHLFINDVKVMDELYKKQAINDRSNPNSWRETLSFPDINGKSWKTRRQLFSATTLTLTSSNFVQEKMNDIIENDISKVILEKHIQGKEPFIPSEYLSYIAFNVVWSATFDQVVPYGDPFVAEFVQLTNKGVIDFARAMLFNWSLGITMPSWFSRRFFWRSTLQLDARMIDFLKESGEFVIDPQQPVFKRSESGKISSNKSGKTSVYVDRLIERLNANEITFDELMSDLAQTIQAGVHTTSNSAEYVFLLLAKYPDAQEKIYKEITTAMRGKKMDQFHLSIVNELHLFRAFIHDALRIAAVAPMGLPHFLRSDTTIQLDDGTTYNIPKSTYVHSNIFYMSQYRNWANDGKPLQSANTDLHLEYWLDADTRHFKVHDSDTSFGRGKRDCPGKALAIRSIYALLGSFVTKYKFLAPENDKAFEIKQKMALVLAVEPKIGIRLEQR